MKVESFTHELYKGPSSWIVDYVVKAKGVGGADLAVLHTVYEGNQVVSAWTNRLYWEGRGKDREGHCNIRIMKGDTVRAVLIDLDEPGEVLGSLMFSIPTGPTEPSK